MKTIRAIGVLLILLCGLGYLTVADDLRHVGELVGVSTIGVAGILLVVLAQVTFQRRRRRG
jgi:hypothetical protein